MCCRSPHTATLFFLLFWLIPLYLTMSVPNVEVYSSLGCKYCRIAKMKLKSYKVPFVDVNIHQEDGAYSKEGLMRAQKARKSTVPQIYVGINHVGGCTELLEAIDDRSLFPLLDGCGVKGYSETPVALEDLTTGAAEKGMGGSPVLAPSAEEFLNTVNFDVAADASPVGGLDAIALGQELQTRSLMLMDKFAIGGGSRIDYEGMRRSDALKDYIQLAAVLKEMPSESLESLPDTQKLSFFANLYNALIVHATCVLGACEDSPAARSAFFSGASGARYNIAGHSFSPDELEHGILRANTRHPYSTPEGQLTYLSDGDPRAALAVSKSKFDARIHFILNCGASSCPPIRVLGQNDKEVSMALQLASQAYLSSQISVQDGVLRLPKLAFWYSADFGDDLPRQIASLMSMLSEADALKISSELGGFEGKRFEVVGGSTFPEAASALDEGTTRVVYNDYSWKSNST